MLFVNQQKSIVSPVCFGLLTVGGLLVGSVSGDSPMSRRWSSAERLGEQIAASTTVLVTASSEEGQGAPQPRASAKFSAADYCQHLMRLKKKLPAGFVIVLQKPFFVVGNESEGSVRQWAAGTVQWTVDHLKRSYFSEDPNEILDIWLFKDKESYDKGTKEVFGDSPDTPYGYFSHKHRALIMNIGTGGGTLAHEIVHPFMAANFPNCPAWFNEGLASLYEQSDERRGQIVGLTNWRLAGLQKAIQAEEKKLPTFKELCGTTTNEFYREDPGTNYAQSRYLCYYLQQRGLLREFYRQFRLNSGADPGGYKTLQQVLNVEDIDRFQRMWESWVLTLRFP